MCWSLAGQFAVAAVVVAKHSTNWSNKEGIVSSGD